MNRLLVAWHGRAAGVGISDWEWRERRNSKHNNVYKNSVKFYTNMSLMFYPILLRVSCPFANSYKIEVLANHTYIMTYSICKVFASLVIFCCVSFMNSLRSHYSWWTKEGIIISEQHVFATLSRIFPCRIVPCCFQEIAHCPNQLSLINYSVCTA